MTHRIHGLLLAATWLLALAVTVNQPLFAVDYLWTAGAGDWNSLTNWDQGFVPDALFEEVGVINNGGIASLSNAATDAAGLRLGDAAGQSGTLRVLSGGSISFIDSTGEPQGIANIGLGGTGVLEVQGGGTFSTTSLDANDGSNVIIGGGVGAASVSSTGTSWFGGTTTVHGPGHTFSIASDVFLEGSGVFNPVLASGSHTALRATGSASLGGALQVDFASGYTPAIGDTWDLVDAAAVTGNFSNAPGGIVPVTGEHAAETGSAYRLRTLAGGTNGQVLQMSLEGLLVLRVNRDTGALNIVNPLGANVTTLAGYSVTSGVGSLLASYKGISGVPVGDSGWEKAPMNSMTGLAEFKPSGSLNVTSTSTNLSLGTGFSKTAVASQGLGVMGEDLTFNYYSVGGDVTLGQVEYFGTQFLNDIALIVNTNSGLATLKNDTLQSIAIDGYTLVSSTGALNGASWTGLGATFANWTKSPASSATALTETNATAPTTLTAGQSVSLGSIGDFSTEAAQAGLAMKFLIGSENSFRFATIQFVSDASQPGDFDGDGDVDGRDFLRWQRGQSQSPLSASDLAAWQANYGSGGSLSAVTAVPEPGTLGLALVGVTAFLARRRYSRTTETHKEHSMMNRLMALLAMSTALLGWDSQGRADVQITFNPAQPTIGVYDQAQLLDDAAIPGGAAPGGGGYNQQAFTDNAGPPGQTFTAPGTSHLFVVTAISVKGVGNTGGGAIDASTWGLRISEVNGTALTPLSTVTGIPSPVGAAGTDWITLTLSGVDVPALEPGGQYAFEVFSSAGWFGIDATQGDGSYAGGTAFNSAGPARSFANNTLGNLAEHGYDRTFIAQLAAPPGGPGDVDNNGSVNVLDYNLMNAHFESTVAIFTNGDLDGNSYVDLNDFARWRNVAPLSALIAAGFAVPEPGTAVLIGAACIGMFGLRRHTRRANAESTFTVVDAPVGGEKRMKMTLPCLVAVVGLCLTASVGKAAVTMTMGAVAPTPGAYDQFDFIDDAQVPGGTTPGGGGYNQQAFSDNNGPPGQIFTTPASASQALPAFKLDSIWLKGAEASGGNHGGFTGSTNWSVRISEVNGTILTPVKTVTAIPTTTGITGNEWFTWAFTGSDLQTLQASKQYAFDLYSSTGWLGFDGDTSDSYTGGTAFNSGGGGARSFNGITTGNLANHGYDRTFLVSLSPSLLVGPGDVDGDGDTDLNDYVIIKTNFFLASGAIRTQGDLTGDGRVLLDDFALWRSSVEPALLAQIAVPEPGSMTLVLVGAGLFGCLRRQSRGALLRDKA